MTKNFVCERICEMRDSGYIAIMIVPSADLELPSVNKVKKLLKDINPFENSIIEVNGCFISSLTRIMSDGNIDSFVNKVFDDNGLTSVFGVFFC